MNKWKFGSPVPTKTTLVTVPSGTIDLEVGGDGVYLRFDCDCQDALPYCKARCCALPGTSLTADEILSKEYEFAVDGDGDAVLKRRADGYCIYNDPKTRCCKIYKDRPGACQRFHCTRGGDMRGWLLHVNRQDGE